MTPFLTEIFTGVAVGFAIPILTGLRGTSIATPIVLSLALAVVAMWLGDWSLAAMLQILAKAVEWAVLWLCNHPGFVISYGLGCALANFAIKKFSRAP